MNNSKQLLILDSKTIIVEKYNLIVRWKDFFVTLFNEPFTDEQRAVDHIG